MNQPASNTLMISHRSDISEARLLARSAALLVGFNQQETEEILIVVNELVSNLVKHAGRGFLTISVLRSGSRTGLEIEAADHGPGIADVEQAISNGFSTTGSLGYGLGTVHRLMDELEINSRVGKAHGTCLLCRRWLRVRLQDEIPSRLEIGAATMAHPKMLVNGDAFVIKNWDNSSLLAVVDGLGHGQFAHRAAQKARHYIETHYDQELASLFRGVGRECRATRGVVMAIARFDWWREAGSELQTKLRLASVGNIETRFFGMSKPAHFIVRRGVIGLNAPPPVVAEMDWEPEAVLVMHSDGLRSRWTWDDYPALQSLPAAQSAQLLLRSLKKEEDDATVLVAKSKNDSESCR